jgi:hypothetical protein
MKNKTIFKSCFTLFLFFSVFFVRQLHAEENRVYEPPQYGLSGLLGYTYDPSDDIYFTQISLCALYDYDRIWRHPAPAALRFKIEGSAGLAFPDSGMSRLISNANILALYYLNFWTNRNITPYVEAGIGLIYTDYTVDGQASRLNFNPQAGLGIEIKRKTGQTNFLALRMHHLSNGGLNNDNRGQNSIILMLGQYF